MINNPTMIPIIAPKQIIQVKETECIVVEGRKFCEHSDGSLEVVGLMMIVLIIWTASIGYVVIAKEQLLLGLGMVLLPFVLMVILG